MTSRNDPDLKLTPDAPEQQPILYSFRRCPYAMRARLALSVSGQTCELREIVLRDKPETFLALSPKGTVPVLQLPDGLVLEESLDVMDWALNQHDPECWLNPEDGDAASMEELISVNDGVFKTALDRYKYANRYKDADPLEERRKASVFLQRLETRLAQSPFLFGREFSLADAAILPFVRQFANVDRTWFDAEPWTNLLSWLDSNLNSSRFLSIMKKYPPWTPGDDAVNFP